MVGFHLGRLGFSLWRTPAAVLEGHSSNPTEIPIKGIRPRAKSQQQFSSHGSRPQSSLQVTVALPDSNFPGYPKHSHSGRPLRFWTHRNRRYCCLVPQPCPTLCDPMDCSPLGSSDPRISQARILCDPETEPGSPALAQILHY